MFDFMGVFVIGATVVWSAAYEYLHVMGKGYAELPIAMQEQLKWFL